MSSFAVSPGFYGKLPTVGDFISRRLPASFVHPWDAWLQDSLATSQDKLGSDWLEIYLTSPIWRFALSAGTCGNSACAGILMPSVDNVGRYFPLTLAVLIEQQTLLPRLLIEGAEWFGKLEGFALSALEDDFNFDEFDRGLQNLVLQPVLPLEELHFEADGPNWESRRAVFRTGVSEIAQIRDAFIDLSGRMLSRISPVYSLWCTGGSERVRPSVRAYGGLPPPSAFVEFIAGKSQGAESQSYDDSSLAMTRQDRKAMQAEAQPGLRGDSVPLKWRSRGRSIVGSVRKINEDSYLERPEIGLWAVADGMGGHKGGQAASKAVVDALNAVPQAGGIAKLTQEVYRCLHRVNADLLEMGRSFGQGVIVGSTVVVMVAGGNRCAAIWVGDSRLYRYRDGNLQQLTQDHSLVYELSGKRSGIREELAQSEFGNVITRALGAEDNLIIDKVTWEAKEKDLFLLCSDGLVREVGHAEIADILSRTDIEQSPQALVDSAMARGARDNVTVIVVEFGH
ncbi:MAG TPA: type VI secretion system-associated protein TagF [Syntrophobacteraceae bacterium]|nr:type VI secretion system-associated protein TagF [Syntrophobacteraceae bacterium]